MSSSLSVRPSPWPTPRPSPRPSPNPSAPPLTDNFMFVHVRPVMPAWGATQLPPDEPPPPYESPEPDTNLGLPFRLQPSYRSDRHRTLPDYSEVEPFDPSPRDGRPTRPQGQERTGPLTGDNLRPKPATVDKHYLWSKFAVLKLLEFVTCAFAFSSCLVFRKNYGLGIISGDRSGLFIMLQIVSWFLVAVLFWMSLIGYLGGTTNPSHFVKAMIIHISLGFLIVISSALLADSHFEGLCKEETIACTTFKVSVGCGFVATVLFWVDAGMHYMAFKQILDLF